MKQKSACGFILTFMLLLFSCYQPTQSSSKVIVDCPSEITARALEFARLYKDSDTHYEWGGQSPLRSIGIDCSGLVIMCYKYALVDTKFSLLESDMTASYIHDKAATNVSLDQLRPGDLLFMGADDSLQISHIGIFDRLENGMLYFVDSTLKDSDGDGIDDIDGVSERFYPIGDVHFKGYGIMKVCY